MTSDNNPINDAFDERIAEIRDSILLDGESIVVQELGDQGQGIILTNSRILVIKVGVTATGMANGKIVGTFNIEDVSAVNVRKGPLGSVIQIVSDNRSAPAEPGPPDNVIIFTGPKKIKKCDAIAAKIEKALGKSVEKVEPPKEAEPVTAESNTDAANETNNYAAAVTAADDDFAAIINEAVAAVDTAKVDVEKPVDPEPEPAPEPKKRGGRKARSLADEIFAEMMESDKENTQESNDEQSAADTIPKIELVSTDKVIPELIIEEPLPEVADEVPETVSVVREEVNLVPDEPSVEVEEEPLDTSLEEGFKPNPRLPKPVKKKNSGKERVLVLLGLLMLAVLVGVAATSPLRVENEEPVASINVEDLTNSPSVIRGRYESVSSFQNNVKKVLLSCESKLNSFEADLQSGQKNSANAGQCVKIVGDTWLRISDMDSPAGLAEAKSSIVNGLFTIKTAVSSTSAASNQETLANIKQGRRLIQNGLDKISEVQKELDSEMQSKMSNRADK